MNSDNIKFCQITLLICNVTALPVCPELHRTVFPQSDDVGSFLCVTGTVVRTTVPKMLEFKRLFVCAKCKYKIHVKVSVNVRKNTIVHEFLF